jgi:sulfur-oxidizing protein SoxY
MTTAGVLVAVQSGILLPRRVLAVWPEEVFEHRDYASALRAVVGDALAPPSQAISVQVPDLIEDGRLVEVTVSTTLDDVEEMVILSEKNPLPLIARFRLTPDSVPAIKTRIKMAGTGDVIALVRANGTWYSARRRATVTRGGCA